MASFTDVGDSVSISAVEKDTPVVVNISGTYDMVIAVQREVRKGSGAFEEVERYTAANAVVEEIFWSDRENQKFQLIVLSDSSGTATATIEIGQILGQAPDTEHTHTLSDITDAGTAAAEDIGTGAGDIPVLDGDGDIPLSMLGKVPAGASSDVVDVANGGTVTLGAFNRIADGASATVPAASGNANKTFGFWLEDGGTTASLAGGLTVTLDAPLKARTFASDGTTWLEYSGEGAASKVVRLTGGSEAPTLTAYQNAIVILASGTQILTAPVSGTDAYSFRGVNKSGNIATIGGVAVPQNDMFLVVVDGTSMTVRTL